jgi:hypothetical protein
MSLNAADAKVLRAALGRRSRPELKRLFALVRAHSDSALLAAVLPAKRRSKRKVDPLVRELEQTLKPILGPSHEKADLLIDYVAKKHRRRLAIRPSGLADAARQLRAKFTDAQISADARSLVAQLSKLYGGGDSVV